MNDLTDAETNAVLLRYDSTHGQFPGDVQAEDGHLLVDGQKIQVLSEKDPARLPWAELGVDRRRRVHRPVHRPRGCRRDTSRGAQRAS